MRSIAVDRNRLRGPALETLLNKMDLHAGRLLRPEFDDLDFDELVDAAGAVGPPLSHMEFRTLWHVSSFTVLGSVEKCSEPTRSGFSAEKPGGDTGSTARDVGGDF